MIKRFMNSEAGSPSAEFALLIPTLVILLFGGFESGNFIWTQHKLVEGAREGARYAARQPVSSYCDGANLDLDADVEQSIRVLTATGRLPDIQGNPVAPVRVKGWSPDDVTVTPVCQSFSAKGIYTHLGHAGPTVVVSSGSVPYRSLFSGLGIIDGSFNLTARSDTAVIGI